MKRFHIIGWTTVACALGTAAWLFHADEPAAGREPLTATPRQQLAATPRTEASRTTRQTGGTHPHDAGFAVAAADGSPAELAEAAEWVHAASRKRLDELTTRYRLTAAQRERIFPMIASHIPGYSPAMLIRAGGRLVPTDDGTSRFGSPLPARTFEDELFAMLDPEQQAKMADEALDSVLWWQEIAAQLEADLNAAITGNTPADGQPDATPPEAPDLDLSDLFGN
jgi:hypothetical protein